MIDGRFDQHFAEIFAGHAETHTDLPGWKGAVVLAAALIALSALCLLGLK